MMAIPEGGTLALDLSGAGMSNESAVGWAYGPVNWNQPQSGHWPLPRIGTRGQRYMAFVNILNDSLDLWKPRNVFIENPLPPQAQTDYDTCRKIYALVGFVEEACARADAAFGGESVSSIRVSVIGRCRWPDGKTKPHVVRFVREDLGMDNVRDHNEADAVVIWHAYRQKMLNIPPAGQLFAWEEQ